MINIHPIRHDLIREKFRLAQEYAVLWNCLAAESTAPSGREPFVQLSYDEITDQQLDSVLAYAGITNADIAIGLVCPMDPVRTSHGEQTVLFFEIDQLERYVRMAYLALASDYDDAGGMDALSQRRGESMTSLEYLVGGLLEVMRHCRSSRKALAIRW